jgi:hypothetical protein
MEASHRRLGKSSRAKQLVGSLFYDAFAVTRLYIVDDK